MRAIVVGGGVLGASAAYHLVRNGAETIVVDRADDGRASAAGAGIVSPWGAEAEPKRYALSAGGARYYPELIAALAEDAETDVGYRRVGGLVAPADGHELDAAEARIRARAIDAQEAGRIERLDPKDAQALFPVLRPDRAAIYMPGGARVDGRKLTAALQRAIQRRGGVWQTGDATLEVEGGRAIGVRLDGETIHADAILVAAGAWAPTLLAPVGVQIAITPQRGQILHFRKDGVDTATWPTVQPLDSFYLLAFDDSRVVVGATRENDVDFDYRLTAAGVRSVLDAAIAAAPGLADWTLAEMRIGFRPMPPHDLAMFGPTPGIDGLYVANGLGARGLTQGPFVGSIIADAMLGRPTALPLGDYPLQT